MGNRKGDSGRGRGRGEKEMERKKEWGRGKRKRKMKGVERGKKWWNREGQEKGRGKRSLVRNSLSKFIAIRNKP